MFGTLTANSKHAINRLMNGGFYRVVVPVGDDTLSFQPSGLIYPFTRFTFEDGDKIAPTLTVVETRPNETLVAGWYIYGIDGQVDVRPLDPVLGVPIRGIYGPTPARFTLQEDGTMIVEQVLEDPKFWGLLDRDVTLSFLALQGNSSLQITVEVDYGAGAVQLFSRSSRAFSPADHGVITFKPPADATQFILRWRLAGNQDASVYLGEVMLQLGRFARPRFTDDLTLLGRPRGMVFFYNGTTPPPGYVTDCEAEGRFMFLTAGDPRTNGLSASRNGGSDAHRHGGRTGGRQGNTKVVKDNSGGSTVNKNHRHAIENAVVDPPFVKVLILQKV